MRYGNVITNVGAGSLPGGQVGDIWWPELPWEYAHEAGWRIIDETVEAPAADPGFAVRLTGYDQSANADYCVPVWEQVAIPPAPVVEQFALPVAAPWVEIDSTDGGKGYAIKSDDNGNLFTILTHASPRRTAAEIAQDATAKAGRIVAADTLLDEAKATLAACVAAIDAAIVELQAVEPTAFNGAQRTAIQALRSGAIALARAAKDGVSATRKVRRAVLQRMRAENVTE